MQKTTQMTLTGYTDASFSEIIGRPFICTINPECYTLSDTLKFELVLDSTGCIETSQQDLQKAITALQNILYRYNGCSHAPNYVLIEWGEAFTFKGTVQSFDVSYSLFNPEGTPLRAKINFCYVGTRVRTMFPN